MQTKNNKTMRKYLLTKKSYFTYLTVFAVLLAFSACSTKVTFPVSNIVPAAEPTATISKNKEGAYEIKLNINNLALPERLSPPKKHYMVWIEASGQGITKLGEISNNRGVFSNKGKASFEAETMYQPTMILVTAENSMDITYPGSNVVLKSKPFKVK